MSAPTKPTRQELRKQLVRLRMEMHRHELRHETHELLQPLRQMRGSAKTWQGTLSSAHAPAWGMAAVTALGFFGARTKKLSRWLKIGLGLYPVISVALKSRPPR